MPPQNESEYLARLIRLEERQAHMEQDIKSIRDMMRWVTTILVGAVLLAFANWVINGGLSIPPAS